MVWLAAPDAGRKRQMSGHGEKLNHKQECAIAALLVAPSVTAAALRSGVNENTLLRWLKDPAFQGAYRIPAKRVLVWMADGDTRAIYTISIRHYP
jgi:hypothetical protein